MSTCPALARVPPLVGLHTRHDSHGRPIEQHPPTQATAVVLIRAAIRRAQGAA